MTPTWFNTADRLARLEASAKDWLGTPFVPNARIKGHGVSCHTLAEQVYLGCGLPFDARAPSADMGWSGVHKNSLVEQFIVGVDGLARLKTAESILVGDLLGFRIGSCIHHLGVVLNDGKFIHSMKGLGTTYGMMSDPTYKDRLAVVWRWKV